MFDYLIKNGQLIDGTGSPARRADVGITDGKIAAIGDLSAAQAGTVIDAAGKTVTPGFIDIHRHADAALFRPHFGELELKQGLTTIVNGNCGLSITPCSGPYRGEIEAYLTPVTGELSADADCSSMQAYLDAARRQPSPIHTAMLAGSGTIRACAAGFSAPTLDAAQLRTVRSLIERELAAGALGVSLGLGYAPDCFYSTETLIEALRPLQDSGIPITVHMRQEGSGVVGALQEMIAVARALRTPVEISHLKSIGKANWRSCTPEMLRLMAEARQEGVRIACDVYPYTAGSTQLVHVLPPETQQGGMEALTEHLADPAFRETLKARMLTGSDFENISLLAGFENIVVSSVRLDAAYGRSLGGACLTRFLALGEIPVGRAIIDGGITPYQLPYLVRKLILARDVLSFKLAANDRKVLEAAFPPERFTIPGHDPVKEYDAMEAYGLQAEGLLFQTGIRPEPGHRRTLRGKYPWLHPPVPVFDCQYQHH